MHGSVIDTSEKETDDGIVTLSASKRAVNSSKFGMLVVRSTEPVRSDEEGGAGKLSDIAAEGFGAPFEIGGVGLPKVNGLMD